MANATDNAYDLKQSASRSPLQLLLTDDKLLSPNYPPALLSLAFQVQYNLQHQHSWTGLRLHTHSPITKDPLPRPLLSGLPPQKIYVHPEEQIELLKESERRRKASKDPDTNVNVKPEAEREWVLPTRLSEKWTLRRLSDVFGGITLKPPEASSSSTSGSQGSKWRTTKRCILATVDTDSTVVYYIIQDGVVKPRQN